MTARAEGYWWVKWYGELRPQHPWRVLEVGPDGEWAVEGLIHPPVNRAWQWGPYLGKEPAAHRPLNISTYSTKVTMAYESEGQATEEFDRLANLSRWELVSRGKRGAL